MFSVQCSAFSVRVTLETLSRRWLSKNSYGELEDGKIKIKILTKSPLFAKQRGAGGEFMCSGFRVKCLAYSVQFKTKRQRPQGARPQDSEA